jgi:hypothetical protein
VNGAEHWREADLILTGDADPCSYGCPHSGCQHEMAMIGRAIAHGLLALAAATALQGIGDRGLPPVDFAEWYRVAAVKPGDEGDLDQADAYAELGRQLAQEDGQ